MTCGDMATDTAAVNQGLQTKGCKDGRQLLVESRHPAPEQPESHRKQPKQPGI